MRSHSGTLPSSSPTFAARIEEPTACHLQATPDTRRLSSRCGRLFGNSGRYVGSGFDRFQLRVAFGDFVNLIGDDRPFEPLHDATTGPADLERIDRRRFVDTDMGPQAGGAEAPPAAHVAINLTTLAVLGDINPDPRTDCKSVRLDPC